MAGLDGKMIALMSFAFLAGLINCQCMNMLFTQITKLMAGPNDNSFLSYSILRIKLYPSLINPHFTVNQYSFHLCNCLHCCITTSGTIVVAFDVKECYLWPCGSWIHLIILRITGYNNPGCCSFQFLAQVLSENERTKMVWCKLKFQLSTY